MLTSPACDGRVLTLTGPEALSVPDQARLLSRALGRVVETMDVPLDVARRQMLDSGMDPAFVQVAIDGRAFVAAGRNATVTDMWSGYSAGHVPPVEYEATYYRSINIPAPTGAR